MNPPSEISIAAFLKRFSRENYRDMPRERILRIVAWYWRDGRCGVTRAAGKIVAIALVRCINTVEEAEKPYFHDEKAPIVWVDDIISRHPQGMGELYRLAERRFGRRESFAGTVFQRDGELRMLPWKVIQRFDN